jgi:hypothetical protein
MKSRFVVGLMIAAIIGLTALCVYQNHVIQAQAYELRVIWSFIQAGCPFNQLH